MAEKPLKVTSLLLSSMFYNELIQCYELDINAVTKTLLFFSSWYNRYEYLTISLKMKSFQPNTMYN
jgi:hypothetical protein